MKLIIAFVSLTVIIVSFLYFFTGYQSAFEADQQCHYELSTLIVDKPNLGCDHDTETRQWLLFDAERADQPAEVVKRYKY